ncbi:MAG TPA: Jag N-terminal domain-containing protein, partial [Candidatus Binatia bacterium]|nr:Jag N-terminal domain-containing protein [Candidatus Binatia bacterium]
MDYVETEGDSIDKAIENALKQLGVERDEITVEVLSEGKKGILGFGSQKARIRAALRKSAIHLPEAAPVPTTENQPLLAAEAVAMGQKAKEVLVEI